MSRPSVAERLASGLVRDERTGCIEWVRYRNHFGHGRIARNGKQELAHRLAWELANGPIPAGAWVLHSCDNPPCCNVAHLRLGTPADNVSDRDARGRGAFRPLPITAETMAAIAELRSRGVIYRDIAKALGLRSTSVAHRLARFGSPSRGLPPAVTQ